MVKKVISTKVKICSRLANRHQPFQRDRFRCVGSKMNPVDGAASGSPVTGLTRRGTYCPIPKPLSRIQLDCTRFCPPPAPAKASAPSSVAKPRVSTGIRGENLDEFRAHVRVAFLIEGSEVE